MKNSAIILTFFLGGLLLGWATGATPAVQQVDLTLATLYLLLFFVGVGIGGDSGAWEMLRRANARILLVPLAVIVGTLLGAGAFSLLLPGVAVRQALAVGAGFGYYSLSSVVITQLGGQTLGVVALLANVMREVLTLLLAPILARYGGKLAPIAAGGATAMDTTLPVISRFVGPEYAVVAVFSGLVLTALVPLLVTLILTL